MLAWLETSWFLCWLGGLHLANEQREDSYHFLVFTDLFGNRTHGVVVQYHRPVQVQRLPPPKQRLSSFVSHWLSALSVLSGWRSPEWTQEELIKVASLYTICCVHHLQIPVLQCSKGLFIMVGISIKLMPLVYVKGLKPRTTRPIIQQGFCPTRQTNYCLNRKLVSQVKAGVYLVGQKINCRPCMTGLMTTGWSDDKPDKMYPVSLLVQLRPARQSDFEEIIKEFSAKLSLVPLPPPGQLHVVRTYSFPLVHSKHIFALRSSLR